MGETAEYQRLQETSESDYQRLPSDDEEVDLHCFLLSSRSRAAEPQMCDKQKPHYVLCFWCSYWRKCIFCCPGYKPVF